MAKIILAVSGGIDSMVMLDMVVRANYSSGDILTKTDISQNELQPELIVAHFDHGIRGNSHEDTEFVRRKASEYGLKFVSETGNLGPNASEEAARKARYIFLARLSDQNEQAEVYTAHHLNDLVESIIINLLRGTGWRGLAVMTKPGLRRPFLEPALLKQFGYNFKKPLTKNDLRVYAARHNLTFREDQSNSSDEYLRNRLRHQMNNFQDTKQLFRLWEAQKKLRDEIDQIVTGLLPMAGGNWQREWFRELDEQSALELLRAGTMRAGVRATRPQLERFRQAILNYASGRYFNLPQNHLVRFKTDSFTLE